MALVNGLTCGKNAVTINIDDNFLRLSFAHLLRLQGFAQQVHFFPSQRRQPQSERGAPDTRDGGRARHTRLAPSKNVSRNKQIRTDQNNFMDEIVIKRLFWVNEMTEIYN